ncbi:MAG: hypothetical protein K2O04_01645 [Clostridiales bacterium]|nr:hypothetical protein [Clostridiales bacterium]
MTDISNRLARMIENDFSGEIKRTMRVAQSDVMALLSEYMDVTKLDMSVEKATDGFAVTITAAASRIYNVGKTSESD